MGLILDSSVVIDAERHGETVERLIERIVHATGDQAAALSAVGLTEIVHGIYRASTPQIRSRREAFLNELLADLTVYPYTKETAMLAGKLDGEQQSKGVVIPFADLLIAATALTLTYSLLTVNVRHFRLIPRLSLVEFQPSGGPRSARGRTMNRRTRFCTSRPSPGIILVTQQLDEGPSGKQAEGSMKLRRECFAHEARHRKSTRETL